MRKTTLTILFLGLSFVFCFGQEIDKEIIDSIFIHADSPSEFRLKFLENCDNAFIIAEQDIKKQEIKILIVGGIAPTIYTTDKDFEKKYQVKYSDYGDLAGKAECMYNYNAKVFDYLTEKYGNKWKKEVRKDVYGLKEWKKNKKKKRHITEKYENEGEAEKARIKEYFKVNYKPEIHTKYSGKIDLKTVNQIDYVDYNSISVKLDPQDEQLKNIFLSGLIPGEMLNNIYADSVYVCCLEELTYLKTKRNQRRFKFLVFQENLMNPSVFLIELTNINSNKKTELNSFITESELTFIKSPWIQI